MVRIHWGALLTREQRRADLSERAIDVTDQERGFDTNHAIAGALERRITARVSARALAVIRAIDLNHETLRGRQEVSDEAPEQRHLTAKDHAQAPAADVLPQELLGCGLRSAHNAGALREDCCALRTARKRGLVVGSSHAAKGAGDVTAPRRIATAQAGAGAARAPSRMTRTNNKSEPPPSRCSG